MLALALEVTKCVHLVPRVQGCALRVVLDAQHSEAILEQQEVGRSPVASAALSGQVPDGQRAFLDLGRIRQQGSHGPRF